MEHPRELGANDDLLKPSHPGKLVDVVKLLDDRWLAQPASAREQ